MTEFMKTERYVITFFGVDTDYYTDDYLLHLWEEAANQQYKNSKIYVTALFEVKTMVCGKTRGCNLENTAHVISTVRNPVESDNQDQFFACLKKIIMEVRSKLGNPCMSIMQETVDYYFFIQRWTEQTQSAMKFRLVRKGVRGGTEGKRKEEQDSEMEYAVKVSLPESSQHIFVEQSLVSI